MNVNISPILFIIMMLFVGCKVENTTLHLGAGNDVLVTLVVLDGEGIDKIEFQANGVIETAFAEDLMNYKTVTFGFQTEREGSFEICVYSTNNKVCSEHYVEKGYRPKLKCNSSKVVVDDTGLGY